jgi:hypothetical protein
MLLKKESCVGASCVRPLRGAQRILVEPRPRCAALRGRPNWPYGHFGFQVTDEATVLETRNWYMQ